MHATSTTTTFKGAKEVGGHVSHPEGRASKKMFFPNSHCTVKEQQGPDLHRLWPAESADIIREYAPKPTVDKCMAKLAGATVFSLLDARAGYCFFGQGLSQVYILHQTSWEVPVLDTSLRNLHGTRVVPT